MVNLLEITGDDIAALSDGDLRTLIAQLCEADFRLAGLSTSGITWGGHQDAPDGGLDVVVRGEVDPPKDSHVPRRPTGFQVKTTKMIKSGIEKEMRPGGVLRNSIKGLAKEKGAYIIVSSGASATEEVLQNLIAAMREAASDDPNSEKLLLDFFDRRRVASWVNRHPSRIVWVRDKVEKPIKGWKPYGNWAGSPGGVDEKYLLDEGFRLIDETISRGKKEPASEGIDTIRSYLCNPKISIRLVGLSGVGKTRFVQALFDERIGNRKLNPFSAIYTDMAFSPDPSPESFAEQLIADKMKAIMIVDNCPPDLHRRLTEICSKNTESTLSLLTVEYEVRDDLPEETSVYRLEPASEGLIERLIQKRFPKLGALNAEIIARFSGGNARIAIALANTVGKGDTLSGLRDEDLFVRIFQQPNTPNENLFISAEALSLVYFFDGEDSISEKSELAFLAAIVEKSALQLFRDVVTLKNRGLVQARSKWRAVLPHALANQMARFALEYIPKDFIVHKFVNCGSERLMTSFSRRLGYLHDSEPAIKIAQEWLATGGWIGKVVSDLSPFEMDVFSSIAPISPEDTLKAIERAANSEDGDIFLSKKSQHYYDFIEILWRVAYNPTLFSRCVELLKKCVNSGDQDTAYNSAKNVIKSLFYFDRSGTCASMETRSEMIELLIQSAKDEDQEIGLLFLDAALETMGTVEPFNFEFGAWPRDYGYTPKTQQEYNIWFETFFTICAGIATDQGEMSERAKYIISHHLNDLWWNTGIHGVLHKSIVEIAEQGQWIDSLFAVNDIIRHFGDQATQSDLDLLLEMKNALRPKNLFEQARLYASSESYKLIELDCNEDAENEGKWLEEETRRIAANVVQDPKIFAILLPDLLSISFSVQARLFGMGIADGTPDKQQTWDSMAAAFETIPPEKRQPDLFVGFLSSCGETDMDFYNSTLDNILQDDLFAKWFPIFQFSASIDARGLERLHRALDDGTAQIELFQYLAWGRNHEALTDDDLAGLLQKIIKKSGGAMVAVEVLSMRLLRGRKAKPVKYSENLLTVSRDTLAIYPYGESKKQRDSLDYHLSQIAQICLKGNDSKVAAVKICRNLTKVALADSFFKFQYTGVLNTIAELQPFVFLDEFCLKPNVVDHMNRWLFWDDFLEKGNPFNLISDTDLLTWCEVDAVIRYPLIASGIHAYQKSGAGGEFVWKPIVFEVLKRAPNIELILDIFAQHIRPRGWSGSLADILEKRLILFEQLKDHPNEKVGAWAVGQLKYMDKAIQSEREWEKNTLFFGLENNQSFE
ncbi:MAG: hypothetical protein JEZ02_07985 [Desulfatibacillum sp.]|nr:hypothetical protein [Desulfatibacillum sp.]